jgi:prepilin-type N-terminal cleavage/methylation domain-containing protein
MAPYRSAGKQNVSDTMKNRGFTLIELMVTLAVMAVLLVLAVPSFEDYFQKARVRGTADQVTDLLARARAAAVKSNMPVAVLAKSESGNSWCVGARQPIEPAAWAPRPETANSCDCISSSAACVVDGEVLVVLGSNLGGGQRPGVVVSDFDFSYSPKLGGVSSNLAAEKSFLTSANSSLTVTSKNGRYELQVIVTPLGQSYVCVPANKPAFFGYRTCPA